MILDLNLIKNLKKEKVRDYIKSKIKLDENKFIEKFLIIADLFNFKWFETELNKDNVIDLCITLVERALKNNEITSIGSGSIYLIITHESDEEEDLLDIIFLIKP